MTTAQELQELNAPSDGASDEILEYLRRSGDPLLQQLPAELARFVVRPTDHTNQLAFVERSDNYTKIHQFLAVVFCCYSYCKMVVVQEGQIAITQYGDTPEVLGPGRHALLAPTNSLVAIRQDTDQLMHHGPIHIILVDFGQLGYAVDRDTGRPILLTQGRHVINNSAFVWKRFITLREQITQLDNVQVIRIEMGSVGYAYKGADLVILQPGLHLIQPPDRFGDTITTQIAILDLPHTNYETSDYVPLEIKAAVFYHIIDPLKALLRIQNVRKQICDTAVATLAGIVRSSSLSDVASRSKPFYHDKNKKLETLPEEKRDEEYGNTGGSYAEKDDDDGFSAVDKNRAEGGSEPFFKHVHDEFLSQLHDHVIEEWGVEIQNIRIESLKISDRNLQKDISSQAISVSKIHNKFLMLQKSREIMRIEAESRSEKIRIETRASTAKSRMVSKAKADTLIIEARAEKEATELKGQGESEYARLLGSTRLGRDLAAMKIQADAIQNISQIAYVPHLPGILRQSGVFADSNMLMPAGDGMQQ